MNTLSTTDKDHLQSIAQNMSWSLIARVMKALNWQWYHVAGGPPSAGEIRDTALGHLARCIHEARLSPGHTATLRTGGFEYAADVCPDSGHTENLRCAFVLESHDSTDAGPGDPGPYTSFV